MFRMNPVASRILELLNLSTNHGSQMKSVGSSARTRDCEKRPREFLAHLETTWACLSPRNRRVPPRCEVLHDVHSTTARPRSFSDSSYRNRATELLVETSSGAFRLPFFSNSAHTRLPKSSLNRLGLRGIFKLLPIHAPSRIASSFERSPSRL